MKTIIASLIAIFMAMPVLAQSRNCSDYNKVKTFLTERHNEHVVARGLTDPTETGEALMMELFANEGNKSWTVVYVSSTGLACIVASGNNFSLVDEPAKPNI